MCEQQEQCGPVAQYVLHGENIVTVGLQLYMLKICTNGAEKRYSISNRVGQ